MLVEDFVHRIVDVMRLDGVDESDIGYFVDVAADVSSYIAIEKQYAAADAAAGRTPTVH